MTKVFLHGALKQKFGGEFKFHINSAKEALLAVNSNRRGFLDEVKKLGAQGIHFKLIIDGAILENEKEIGVRKSISEIHILPVIWGAQTKKVGWFKIFLAVVIAIIGWATGTGSVLYPMAASIAVSGLMDILYPAPKPNFTQEVQAGAQSYLFGNKYNNTAQGQPVPVGYGRLKIGSSQISAGIDHYSLKTDVKQLMTPVDQPINDYIELRFANEAPDSSDGLVQDSFYTNQSTDLDRVPDLVSANIVNSYVDIVSKNANKVASGPVEIVVKRNGEVVSNINLDTYDEDIEYEWTVLSENAGSNKIKIEYPYAFQNGLVYRSYHPIDFKLTSNFVGISSTEDGYFSKYESGKLVKYGPTQFNLLPISDWDFSYRYYSGELVRYQTGTQADVYFQATVTGTGGLLRGFDGTNTAIPTNPTGSNGAIRTAYWRKILPPTEERVYKLLTDYHTGELPSTGTNTGNLPYWTGLSSPTGKIQFDELMSGMPSFKYNGVYNGIIEATNEQRVLNSRNSVDNYAMEFMGYLYIPVADNLKKQVPDTTEGVMYEIIKVGNTGQWAAIGLTGAGGVPIPPKRGITFVKNSYQSNGDGVVYPVVKYNFKIDSDDAADLYIDGQAASVWYSGHGFANPNSSAAIAAMPSSSGELLLTAGYHHLYGRFQDSRGSEGISFYYQYDTNWDNTYSNFVVIPADRLKYRQISDSSYPDDKKFMPRSWGIPLDQMVSGKQYKIINLGNTTNWGSLGASSPRVGSVFTKTNNTPANATGLVFEDVYNYAESKSSEGNRVVQFSAERPKINGVVDAGYSYLESKYNCKVTLDGITVATSPAKIKVKFLNSNTASTQRLREGSIPVGNYIT